MVLLQTLAKDSLLQKTEEHSFLEGILQTSGSLVTMKKGAMWLAEKNGVEKTKAEAQALVDAEVTAAQAAWDALPEEQKTDMNPRPTEITLP
jgi:hypothetical protein